MISSAEDLRWSAAFVLGCWAGWLIVGLGDMSGVCAGRGCGVIAVHRVIQHLTRLDAETRNMAIPYCSAAITILDASL